MPAFETDSLTVNAPDTTSVQQHNPHRTDPFEARSCHAEQAPSIKTTSQQYFATGRAPFTQGIAGEPRPLLPGYDTGVMCLLIGTFLILAANFRHYSTFLKTFAQDLWKVRNRSNIFDDHTMSETKVLASFIMLLCLSEGIIVHSAISYYVSGVAIFRTVALTTCLAIAFYLMQLAIYQAVGYVFTTTENASQWIKGFRASQSLLGVTIVIPALVVLFNPGLTMIVAAIALALYIISRIIFIFKGFRIFYTNSFSLIYFILYLCTLEIIPPIMMYKAAVFVTLFFE